MGNSAFLYRCGTHECDSLSSSIPPSLSSDASLLSPRKPVLLPFQTYKMSLLDVSTNVALSLVVTGPLNFSMLLDMVMKLKYISGGLKDTETLSTGNLEYDVVELDQKRYLLQVKALSEGGTSALHVKVSEEDDRKEKEKPIARRLSMVTLQLCATYINNLIRNSFLTYNV